MLQEVTPHETLYCVMFCFTQDLNEFYYMFSEFYSKLCNVDMYRMPQNYIIIKFGVVSMQLVTKETVCAGKHKRVYKYIDYSSKYFSLAFSNCCLRM